MPTIMEIKKDAISVAGASSRDENRLKTLIIGTGIVLGVSISYVGATQYSESSLTSVPGVYDPFFLTWFSTSWMIICYPIYLILTPLLYRCKVVSATNLTDIVSESVLVFGPNGITVKTLALKLLPFLVFWIVANYCYSQALGHISAGETTSIFGSCSAFVYVLSLFILRDRFVFIRLLAVIISITGVAIMPLGTGFGKANAIGISAALISSMAAAVYKVLFKKIVGNASFGQVSLFMSLLGLANLLINWIIVLILIETKTESVIWSKLPWNFMCSSAVLNLIYNFLINLGIALTHPLFISVGLFLGIPFNSIVDMIVRNVFMDTYEWIGTGCILLSFFLMLLPENFEHYLIKRLCRRRTDSFVVNET